MNEIDDDYDAQSELEEKIEQFFELHSEEFLETKNIKPERRLHARPDLNAFLLLDKLAPGICNMVSAAEHAEIWLDVNPYEVMKVATDEDLLDLIRCGTRLDDGSFCMFV